MSDRREHVVSVPEEAVKAAEHFVLGSCMVEPLGRGNINDTFLITSGRKKVVLQRINSRVFPDPRGVVRNSARVTKHLRGQRALKEQGYVIPAIVHTAAGNCYHRDDDGEFWRGQEYIENSMVFDRTDDTHVASEVGKCLAVFHNSLAGLSSVELAAPLPGFHDIDAYLQQYDRASDFSAMESDGDLSYCAEIIAGYRERSYRLVGAAREGIIRKRIVHGDPKIANFLLHESTAKPLALIDLDTVGPGFLLHDIGDCLRSLICSSGEGGLPGEISLQTELVGAMLRGYSRVNVLAEREKRCIFDALFILTFELGVRFLTDHLRGDSYFKVNAAGENLRRAVVQLKLAELIAGSEQELRRVSL